MKAIYLKFVLLAMLATTTACTVLGSGIRERAETAFRRQNQLSSEFMLAAPEVEKNQPARYESLLLKEERMLDACRPLNTLATKRRDNKSASFEEKKSILGSLDACELASDDFAKSLQNALHRTAAPLDATEDPEPASTGWQIVHDNDLLISATRDKDYTSGFALALGGSRVANYVITLDPALSWLNKLLFRDDWLAQSRPDHQMQFGLTLFTPVLRRVQSPQFDDRPYANLLFVENSQFRTDPVSNHAYQSSLTFGILGSRIGEASQDLIHRIGNFRSGNGYDYQISDGGEFTARYAASRQSLWLSRLDRRGRSFDLKYRMGADIGYITEASANLAARWGRISSPWWRFAPTRSNYLPQPLPEPRRSSRQTAGDEFYVWSAVTLHARAYNVFLQGQFRDSVVTFSSSELNHLIIDLSVGVNKSFGRSFDVNFAVHLQSNEIKTGIGARDIRWGSLSIAKSF